MSNYDWESDIKTWVTAKRTVRDFETDLIHFFSNVFRHTRIPDKSYFGTTKTSISLLVGGIYLAAYGYSGNLWLLLDKKLSPIIDVEYQPVKSTKSSKNRLTWLHTQNLKSLSLINNTPTVWYSYSLASLKVIDTPKGYSTRQDFIRNKQLLNTFWKQNVEPTKEELIVDALNNDVAASKLLSKEKRAERLKTANKKPARIESKTNTFIRNPDVIAEVLERANGICEVCRKPAPFIRDSDNSPYLEIHHKIPLSKGGEDAVDNAIALCPNCHRYAHFGEKTFTY